MYVSYIIRMDGWMDADLAVGMHWVCLFQTGSVLNYGRRHGQFSEHESGKYSITSYPPHPTHLTNWSHTTLLQSITERNIKIPLHIDVYLARGKAEPSNVNGIDLTATFSRENAVKLESASRISGSLI